MEIPFQQPANWNATQVRFELPRGSEEERLRAVAVEFEALFAKQMLNAMRQTLDPESDMLDGGMAEDIFEDMLFEEYSRQMANTGSLGIADLIVQQFSTNSTSRAAEVYDSFSSLP